MSLKKNIFFDFFPPPSFLEMIPGGFSFSERVLRFVALSKTRHGLRLDRFDQEPLPLGAITGGYVTDRDAVKKALQAIKSRGEIELVNASLPEEKVYLFSAEVPLVQGTDLSQIVEFKIEENAPISAKEALFDYTILPGRIAGAAGAANADVSVSVFPEKVVTTYAEILKEAGIKPLAFEVGAQAVARAIVPEKETGVMLTAKIDETRIVLSIVAEGVVRFVLTVPGGGGAIVAALAEKLGVSTTEAERVKNAEGFTRNKKSMELFLPIIKNLPGLTEETHRLLAYWQGRSKGLKPVEKILIIGKNGCLSGVNEFFSTLVKVPAETGNVWTNVFSLDETVPALPRLEAADFAAAIGLALSSFHTHV